MKEIELLVDGHNGVYCPQIAWQRLPQSIKDQIGLDDADVKSLEAGPEDDAYWDIWEDMLNETFVFDETECMLYQNDGDVWIMPVDDKRFCY